MWQISGIMHLQRIKTLKVAKINVTLYKLYVFHWPFYTTILRTISIVIYFSITYQNNFLEM